MFYVVIKETGFKTGPFKSRDTAHMKGVTFYGTGRFDIVEEVEEVKEAKAPKANAQKDAK